MEYNISPPVFIRDKLWNGSKYLDAIIHISGLELGPALGGCRVHHYERYSEAEKNVERLSSGMRLKCSLAGVPLGGGKAVIVADPEVEKTKKLMRNFAAMVNELNGAYITAEDSGTDLEDINHIAQHTEHVVGTNVSGNPSPVTAYGVYKGLLACLKHTGNNSPEKLAFAIKGTGSVASYLIFGFPKEDKRFDEFREDFPGLIHMKPKIIYYADKESERSLNIRKKAIEIGLKDKIEAKAPDEIY